MNTPSYLHFNQKEYAWTKDIDYRKEPHLYKVGKGEHGVLICEPYKSEILPNWKFKTSEVAKISSEKIYNQFLDYLSANDFVGADMARKFLQMGFTRSRRYANYKGGKKYLPEKDYKELQRGTGDSEKAVSADIFFQKWKEAEAHLTYCTLKKEWKDKHG